MPSLCLWDSCLPLISSGSTYRRVGALHPVPSGPFSFVVFSPSPPHIGQWTHPFYGTIPHAHSQVNGFSGLICLWAGLMLWLEADAWDTPPSLLLGTFLSTFTLPPVEPPIREAGLFLLEVASLPMPRNEHISGCQFDLHISASPVPMVQSFHDPCSTHPPAAQLCHSDQARGRGRH